MSSEASYQLREFVATPEPKTALEQLQSAVADLPVRLATAVSGQDVARFVAEMSSPMYQLSFSLGFLNGFGAGSKKQVAVWRRDLERVLALFATGFGDIGDLTTVGIAEQFVRPLFEDHPKGLLPQSEELLAGKKWIANLASAVAGIEALLDTPDLLIQLEIVATDLIGAITTAGEAWNRQFFFQTGLPEDQGYLLGELIGIVTIEVFRMVVEPDSLMALELGSLLVEPEGAAP